MDLNQVNQWTNKDDQFIATVEKNDLEQIRTWLQQSKKDATKLSVVTKIDPKGHTAIHRAASRGHSAIVGLFLLYGVDTGSRDAQGRVPLHETCRYGHVALAEMLLKKQATSIRAVDNYGLTPLHHACIGGQADCVRLLLRHDAPVNVIDKESKPPIAYAASLGHSGICKMLVDAEADTSVLEGKQRILYSAASEKTVDTLRSNGREDRTEANNCHDNNADDSVDGEDDISSLMMTSDSADPSEPIMLSVSKGADTLKSERQQVQPMARSYSADWSPKEGVNHRMQYKEISADQLSRMNQATLDENGSARSKNVQHLKKYQTSHNLVISQLQDQLRNTRQLLNDEQQHAKAAEKQLSHLKRELSELNTFVANNAPDLAVYQDGPGEVGAIKDYLLKLNQNNQRLREELQKMEKSTEEQTLEGTWCSEEDLTVLGRYQDLQEAHEDEMIALKEKIIALERELRQQMHASGEMSNKEQQIESEKKLREESEKKVAKVKEERKLLEEQVEVLTEENADKERRLKELCNLLEGPQQELVVKGNENYLEKIDRLERNYVEKMKARTEETEKLWQQLDDLEESNYNLRMQLNEIDDKQSLELEKISEERRRTREEKELLERNLFTIRRNLLSAYECSLGEIPAGEDRDLILAGWGRFIERIIQDLDLGRSGGKVPECTASSDLHSLLKKSMKRNERCGRSEGNNTKEDSVEMEKLRRECLELKKSLEGLEKQNQRLLGDALSAELEHSKKQLKQQVEALAKMSEQEVAMKSENKDVRRELEELRVALGKSKTSETSANTQIASLRAEKLQLRSIIKQLKEEQVLLKGIEKEKGIRAKQVEGDRSLTATGIGVDSPASDYLQLVKENNQLRMEISFLKVENTVIRPSVNQRQCEGSERMFISEVRRTDGSLQIQSQLAEVERKLNDIETDSRSLGLDDKVEELERTVSQLQRKLKAKDEKHRQVILTYRNHLLAASQGHVHPDVQEPLQTIIRLTESGPTSRQGSITSRSENNDER